MSNRADALIGFAVAGVIVIFLAKWQPQLALGVTGLVALGVALQHSQEITDLYGQFAQAAHPF